MKHLYSPVFPLLAGILALSALSQHAAAQDSFGYDFTFIQETGADPYIDIEATGLTAVSRGATVATVLLDTPVTLYGETVSSIRVSKNGYLTTDFTDPGTDTTPDNPLPTTPSEGGGNRIYVAHSELNNPTVGDSRVLYQYFGSSPHPHHDGGVHVFTWLNYVKPGAPNNLLTFQLLLFDNTDIRVHHPFDRYLNIDGTSTAIVGVQNAAANSGIGFNIQSFNAPQPTSWLFEMPTVTVTTANDELNNNGATSLREAVFLLTNGSNNGGKIDFAGNLSGATLTLGQLLEIPKPISIDASRLLNRFTITTAPSSSVSINSQTHFQILGVDFPDILVPIEQTFFRQPLFVHSCDFSRCTTAISGRGDIIVTASTFTDNTFASISALNPQDASVVHVEDSTFDGNESGNYGGAIKAQGDYRITVIGSTFTDNTAAQSGGAISARDATSVTVKNCTFDGNHAATIAGDAGTPSFRQGGGAIFLDATQLTATASLFRNNSSAPIDVGGGFDVENAAAIQAEIGDVFLRECTFDSHKGTPIVSNDANSGGSIMDADVVLQNTTITGNSDGTLIRIGTENNLRLAHCTFAGNTYLNPASQPSLFSLNTTGTVTVHHCIFAENTLAEGDLIFRLSRTPTFVNEGFNLTDADEQTPFDPALEDQLKTDPQLGSFGDNGGAVPTIAIAKSSPAVDTGNRNINFPPSTDARGYPRIAFGGSIDIGAFERQDQVQVTTAVDEDLDPGTGTSLREAFDAVADDGTITFAPALSGQTLFTSSPHLPLIPANATVDASALPQGIILNRTATSSSYRTETGGSATFKKLTFTGNGRIVTEGAGTFTDCNFIGIPGDVIFAKNHLVLTRCSVRDSVGVRLDASGDFSVDITDCEFLNCERHAIAMSATTNTLTVTRTNIANTRRDSISRGYGISSGTGTITLDSTTISGSDSGSEGGAIHASNATVNATNCTISGNHSDNNGGAIYANATDVTLAHCTIVGNSAGETGGIFLGGASSLSLTHTILAGNIDADDGEIENFNNASLVTSEGHNIIDSTDYDVNEGDLPGIQPLLAPLSRYGTRSHFPLPVHAPLSISPAIDAGNEARPNLDQRGFARTVGTSVDIGAVEAGRGLLIAGTPQSLTNALATAADGDRIIFPQDLDGATLDTSAVSGGYLVDKSIQIDATTLPNGLTLDGGNLQRLFNITDGSQVAMHALNLTEGRSTGNTFTGSGGGVYVGVGASLTFTHGSISSCESDQQSGGGIYLIGGTDSYLKLHNATISGNSSQQHGGAVFVGPGTHADIEHSTIAHNSAGPAQTAGLHLFGPSTATAYSTVIAENLDTGGQLLNFGRNNTQMVFSEMFDSRGYLVTDSPATGELAPVFGATDKSGADPDLAPVLINSGGWSMIHAFFPGSPLEDASKKHTAIPPIFDGRGYARRAGDAPDIGAYERLGDTVDTDGDGMPDYWEHYYSLMALESRDATDDPDNDGANNLTEFQNGTNPKSSDAPQPELPVFLSISSDGTTVSFTYAGPAGQPYAIETSPDLASWTNTGNTTTMGFGTTQSGSATVTAGQTKFFIRLRTLTN